MLRHVLLGSTVLLGCDAQLSRFDRIDASVGARPEAAAVVEPQDGGGGTPATADPDPPAVTVGDDVPATNQPVTRTITATAGAPVAFHWRVIHSGDADLIFSDANTATTTITGTATGTYVVEGEGVDALGRPAVDSFTLNWDVTPPPDVQAFTGDTGSRTETVTLNLTFQAPLGDLARVDVRRLVAPEFAGECDVGDVAKTFLPADLSQSTVTTVTFEDDTNAAGKAVSYRVCVYDLAGNVKAGTTIPGRIALPHTLFASSRVFNGALIENPVTLNAPDPVLSGPERADSYCQQLGATLNVNDTWRAIISDSGSSAVDRIVVTGVVENSYGDHVADDEPDLFDGSLDSEVYYDEGAIVPGADAWTGSDQSGAAVAGNTCDDWSSSTNSFSGRTGQTDTTFDPGQETGAAWISDVDLSCNQFHSLYCISQGPP